jgi:predicted metal-dependent phosphoesterase TrpH
MHTTASDGRLAPVELVARVAAAGLTTLSVTDHDTVASIAEVTGAAQASGIRVVPGIEVTAVDEGRDLHVLGYFFDPLSERLAAFLLNQRSARVSRVREIVSRLAAAGLVIDADGLVASAASRPGSSLGRPQIAREMVRAGQVGSVQEAFDVWLAAGRPAYVPRTGPSPATVIDVVHDAGGVASFAHPGVSKRDELIAPLVEHGLDAIEVYHPDHTAEHTAAYRAMAARLGTAISGGSDFHGEDTGQPGRAYRSVGAVTLPVEAFSELEARTASRRHNDGGQAAKRD